MKRILLVFMLFFMFPLSVSAEGKTADEIYAASGAQGLDAGNVLERYGISFDDPSSILDLSPSLLWEIIKETVAEKTQLPLKLLVSLGIIIVLTSFSRCLGDTVKSGSSAKIYELICVLAAVAAVSPVICEVLENTAESLKTGAEFMKCFVPVFAAIAAAGGNITSAAGYNVLVLMVSDAAIQIADSIFMPILSMCFCIAIVDASSPALSLKGMLGGLKKVVTWGLGLIMTVFTGLLSIQSIVGTSADSLGSKTAKYVISNCIPIVGGAVSDAYSTVKGSLTLLKNGVGGVGIAVLALTLLSPLVSLILYKLAVSVASASAEIFGADKLSGLFANINSVLSAAMSVLVCFILMFIVSTAIIMSFCTVS